VSTGSSARTGATTRSWKTPTSKPCTSRYRTRCTSHGRCERSRLSKIRALSEIAAARGQSLAQLALAWTLRDPRVTSALVGASSVEQLEANVGALERLDFTAEELAEIERHAIESGINIWAASSVE
jgi:L-glyceraldehyde 3-phosphate reductase